jgi:hypothetical protein
MKIGELFDTRVEEKIEPVIKVGETGDARKLAKEIGSYVVTPLIEKYIDQFLEHYTDTFRNQTTEIGVWISGYFGSGKSHLAKIISLLAGNRELEGSTACKRFAARVPSDSAHRGSIERSLARMGQCGTSVLAFNLNTLADSKSRPLSQLLLSEYYKSCGYGGNLLYAKVIEAELDKDHKLQALHEAVEARTGKRWADIRNNLTFFRRALYEAACEVAPKVFDKVEDVERALRDAERGELYNVAFLIDTILTDLAAREKSEKRPLRMLLVLDESGQWIENDAGRLSQLQALIEEAAIRGQGKLWIIVTTHGDMGSIYKEARALEGDMKKIEGRFRFKWALTTENIERVLEDRLFKKRLAGKQVLDKVYQNSPGELRNLGELAGASQALPQCSEEKFPVYYPFFPYQVHLIPEIVKSLRSKGGRGEQLSGSTRTLLAITQDILRAGRRPYLSEEIGPLVSFDEVYANLAGEGEVSPDVRTELSRIPAVVRDATELTAKVAEVLYLIREIAYIPRTRENIARLLATDIRDDLATLRSRVDPELERLRGAKLVARNGDEYEFLTGERRTFEEEVATREHQILQQDRERGLAEEFIYGGGEIHVYDWLDFKTVPYLGYEFPFRLFVDNFPLPGRSGDVSLRFTTPLSVLAGSTISDLETESLRQDHQHTLFFLSGRIAGFDADLSRFLAMKEVIGNWKGDQRKSEESRRLALDREANDLDKLRNRVLEGLRDGIRTGWLVFRGASRSIGIKPGQKPGDALRAEMAGYWQRLYPQYEKLTVRISDEQRAIKEVLAGAPTPGQDVKALRLHDKAGKLDPHHPLLDAIRIHMTTRQNEGKRVLGADLAAAFSAPPYGWDSNAVRIGIAAMVRAGTVKVVWGKKPLTNPADPELIDALRISRNFDKAELVLEDAHIDQAELTQTRAFLIELLRRRSIDETPAALSEAAQELAGAILVKAESVRLWSQGSGMPLPAAFNDGVDRWEKVRDLTNPTLRVSEVFKNRDALRQGYKSIEQHAEFIKEHGPQFVDMGKLINQLTPVEDRLDADTALARLLDGHGIALGLASFADGETWRQLQALRAQALLELPALLDGWRNEARAQIDEALVRLPDDLAARGLPAELLPDIQQPLRRLRDTLDSITVPSHVAALPQKVAQVLRAVARLIVAAEEQKQTIPIGTGGDGPPPAPPPRPIRRLLVREVATVTTVRSEEEWDALKARLDARVRRLLKDGSDVELG